MTDQTRGVHLFENNVLLANLTTTATSPEDVYEIDGISYHVTSYLTITEPGGRRGFDVQVERSSPPRRS